MNDERLADLLAAHAGPTDVDPRFEDDLYALLRTELGGTRRGSRPVLLLVAALVLALAVGGAALVLSGLIDPPTPPNSSESRLAYELDGDIYLADADGQHAVRIADGVPGPGCGNFWGEGSMWSPDGRYIAYRSGCSPSAAGFVHVTDAGGDPVATFPGGGWLVSWSPDSTRIATWVEAYGPTIAIHGLDGERQALLTVGNECNHSGDWDPVWSPDGQSVMTPDCELPLDGGAWRGLASDDPHRSWSANAYSADGTRVAYVTPTSFDSAETDVSLVIAEVDGTPLRVVNYEGAGDTVGPVLIYNLVWSPSGDRVAFSWSRYDANGNTQPSSFELRMVDVASGVETTVATESIVAPLAFSPDGDRILFSTRNAAYVGTGLWSVNVDGSDVQLLVAGAGWGDWQPLPPGSHPSATPTALPSAAASAAASAAPSTTPVALPTSGDIASGTYYLVNPYQDDDPVRDCERGCADYRRIDFTLPAGWATSGGLVHKHLGQGDEVAFSVWTPDQIYADPCHWEESALEDLAIHTESGSPHLGMDPQAALLNQVGRTASVPTTVEFTETYPDVAGEMVSSDRGALRIELAVDPRLDLATCDRGEFRSWTEWDVSDGANSHHAPGQFDVVYLVDVDRRTFVIDASHMPGASEADLAELEAILASMIVDR